MSGFVMYEGVSRLDGVSPLALIVTLGSRNRKTGDIDQAWILRSDLNPIRAVLQRKDDAICGSCRHRTPGARSCYVNVFRAPNAIYEAYQAGKYPRGYPRDLAGRFLRIGAYGDPAALPRFVWEPFFDYLQGWIGYTHQWRTCDRAYKTFLMASVDTEAERDEAIRAGWRTFRVRHTETRLLDGEIVCPASAEAGHRTTCDRCRLCSGATVGKGSTRSVAIYAHGQATVAFFRSAQAALNLSGSADYQWFG